MPAGVLTADRERDAMVYVNVYDVAQQDLYSTINTVFYDYIGAGGIFHTGIEVPRLGREKLHPGALLNSIVLAASSRADGSDHTIQSC